MATKQSLLLPLLQLLLLLALGQADTTQTCTVTFPARRLIGTDRYNLTNLHSVQLGNDGDRLLFSLCGNMDSVCGEDAAVCLVRPDGTARNVGAANSRKVTRGIIDRTLDITYTKDATKTIIHLVCARNAKSETVMSMENKKTNIFSVFLSSSSVCPTFIALDTINGDKDVINAFKRRRSINDDENAKLSSSDSSSPDKTPTILIM